MSVGFASVGFASVGFSSVGFGSVGFGSVGFASVGFRSDGFQKDDFGVQLWSVGSSVPEVGIQLVLSLKLAVTDCSPSPYHASSMPVLSWMILGILDVKILSVLLAAGVLKLQRRRFVIGTGHRHGS